jgi:hypothetical protein
MNMLKQRYYLFFVLAIINEDRDRQKDRLNDRQTDRLHARGLVVF